MGDRTNFVISYKSTADAKTLADALPGSLVLYSHWGGYEAGPSLSVALKAAKPRWTDYSYCARIIVSQIVGDYWKDETGYGLLVGEVADNEHAILLVDLKQQKVRLFGDAGEYLSLNSAGSAKPTAEWSFAEFAEMDVAQAGKAHQGDGSYDED